MRRCIQEIGRASERESDRDRQREEEKRKTGSTQKYARYALPALATAAGAWVWFWIGMWDREAPMAWSRGQASIVEPLVLLLDPIATLRYLGPWATQFSLHHHSRGDAPCSMWTLRESDDRYWT
ncbi:hypothetical protein GY45DRAFT_953812 [Cubamyces sp. BRFM 1775]|nr:hypothetical protein GY45DRAFT_953812 [Cubamyces sp. BRFM 1775]